MAETPKIGRVAATGRLPQRKKKVAGMLSRRIRIEGVVVCNVVSKRSISSTVG
jgi:hypothetical protein